MDAPDRNSSNLIRISRDEADSRHVDDLLRRQMSLRGEPGITRDHGRYWFYQNWFVLMIAGLLASLAAWAILEPHFDDMVYLQGPVDRIEQSSAAADAAGTFAPVLRLRVRNATLLLMNGTADLTSGSPVPLDPSSIEKGREYGFYCITGELGEASNETVPSAVARFVVANPPPQSPSRAALTISQLQQRSHFAGMMLFPLIAAFVGLTIGAVDGIICRQIRRALLAGGLGLLIGFIGGFISTVLATLVYAPLTALALKHTGDMASGLSTTGFVIQMGGRGLAWCLVGSTVGLAQGIVLRSRRLLLYGLLGGVIGGLFGGLLFDPIDLLLLGSDKPSAHWSRLIGFGVIGASVGAMIGVVELLARDAWLLMVEGPLAGKEFLIFKDVVKIGASPRSDIYLFNDPLVAAHHATISAAGDESEISSVNPLQPVMLNERPIKTARLRHGDRVAVGRTIFTYQKRQG